jgi:hypothetical protein
MITSLHSYILGCLKDAKGHWPKVAAASGVPLRTLQKIASQEIPNPGIKHVEALAEYFRKAA